MFWSDKTEAPTPKRREEARKHGIVPRSAELTGSLVMLIGLSVGAFLFPSWWQSLSKATSALIVHGDWSLIVKEAVIKPVVFITILMFISFFIGSIQTKFLLTLHPLKFDWQKINPLSGMKRMVSLMGFWDLLRMALKAGLIAYIGFITLKSGMTSVIGSSQMELTGGISAIGSVGSQLLWRIVIVLVVLAMFDYGVQWWRIERSLRMTRQEVRDELKQLEGDLQVKARIRRRHRQFVLHRQIQRVKEATVVVTNPTHIAVALYYELKRLSAPQIIAKGTDWVAQRIVMEARRHGIPIVQNPPLAQALIKLPVGSIIPAELYLAAAEVLAYVFRTSGRVKEVLGEA